MAVDVIVAKASLIINHARRYLKVSGNCRKFFSISRSSRQHEVVVVVGVFEAWLADEGRRTMAAGRRIDVTPIQSISFVQGKHSYPYSRSPKTNHHIPLAAKASLSEKRLPSIRVTGMSVSRGNRIPAP